MQTMVTRSATARLNISKESTSPGVSPLDSCLAQPSRLVGPCLAHVAELQGVPAVWQQHNGASHFQMEDNNTMQLDARN